MSQAVALIGATGLIGGHVLDYLLEDPLYSEVRIIVRRPFNLLHEKLKKYIVDFENPEEMEEAIAGCETVFCAVGTTNRKTEGDRDAYRKVDFDIPVNAAKVAAKFGVFGFVLVSSVGADPANNNNFYLKLKGVTEEAVSKEQIPQVIFMRPSLLLGKRNESRFGETVAQFLAPAFSWAMSGKRARYKPIKAKVVAKAMVMASQKLPKGIHMLEYPEIVKFGGRGRK